MNGAAGANVKANAVGDIDNDSKFLSNKLHFYWLRSLDQLAKRNGLVGESGLRSPDLWGSWIF